MPLVSVIIPAYNAENYIEQCVASVLRQTVADIEVIVVDDGSNDGTPALVENMAKDDNRLTLIRQENQFAGSARNNGMAHSNGEYLYFLDSDDYIDDTLLEKMLESARQNDADVVVCRSRSLDMATGKIAPIRYAVRYLPFDEPLSRDQVSPTLFQSFVGWPWDKLFKRELIDSFGLKYQPLRTTNDAYFVFIAMALAESCVCLDEELVTHRANNSSSLEGTRSKSWHNAFLAMDAIESRLKDEGLYELFKRSYLNWCVDFSFWNASTLDHESAKQLLISARPYIGQAPKDREFYLSEKDYQFARLYSSDRDDLLVETVKLLNEYEGSRRAKNELGRLRASRSYRIGRMITAPLRKIRSLLDHGSNS